MYPRARTKAVSQGAGHADGEELSSNGQPSRALPTSDGILLSSTTSTQDDSPLNRSHQASQHPTSGDGGERQHLRVSKQQEQGPCMQQTQVGNCYEQSQDTGDVLSPTTPRMHAGRKECRTISSSHEQPQLLSPPLTNSYHGEWIGGSNSCPPACGATALGASSVAAAPASSSQVKCGNNTISTASFNNSIVSSGCITNSYPCTLGSSYGEYRQPPSYGERSYNNSNDSGAAAANNVSITPMNCGKCPFSSPAHHVGPTNRSPGIRSSATVVFAGAIPGNGVTVSPVPSHTSIGAPLTQMKAAGCASSTAMCMGTSVPGVTSLKIKVGGNTSMVTAAPSLSPLMYSSMAPYQQQQTHSQILPQCTNESLTCQRRVALNSGKASGIGGGGGTAASVGAANSLEMEFDEDHSSEKDRVLTAPTIEEAEARYRYLYEEYRKVNGVRAKLLDENNRMKREQSKLRHELSYYRNKTALAAEEKEALVADYRNDVHHVLRLARMLAKDVAAAHENCACTSQPASVNHDGCKGGGTMSTRQALNAAIARLPSNPIPVGMAAPRTVSSPDTPSLLSPTQSVASFSQPTPSFILEQLGLHFCKWATMQSSTLSPPPVNEENDQAAPQEQQYYVMETPHQQAALLRDEIRDVHRNTHAAVSAYMTSLDYSSSPGTCTQNCPPTGAQGEDDQRQLHFISEYCGLHVHVDVPRFHAQTEWGSSDPANTVAGKGE